ncbi:MAG: 1-aminocyclopropane-1-carboxylate deaminase/D-cysteine desulfhydrase [Myxococcota bacterium]
MATSEPALLRAYPSLRRCCPHRAFTELPTPVEPLALEGVPDGRLFVKRDDRSCPLYGGNKPRKLEFIIGAALARGARRLVTSGAIGTHHGLATTVLGREAGLATTVVLVPQPVSEDVRHTLRSLVAYGADLVYGGGVGRAVLAGAAALCASALRGERPVLVATGGSSATGNLGFVSAGLELAEQVRSGEMPEPAEVWLPVGSGGTLAGLIVGLRLAGLASRVVGVLVTDLLAPSPARLARAATATARALRRFDAGVPITRFSPADFDLVLDHVGPGYGAPTREAQQAVAEAAACGLQLDGTYTGKALAALLSRARRADTSAPLLFWNTMSGVDTDAGAPVPLDDVVVPPRFRRLHDAGLPPAAEGLT